jgi:plastocyanin
MKKVLTVLALATLLAAAGCGGGESPPPTTSGPPAGEGAAEGGRVLVDIRDLQFQPSEVTAPAGATVVFTNSDQVSHTVTKESGPGPDFDSGPIEPGGTFSQVFPAKGEVEIVDSQRPETKLTLTIE